MKKIFFGILLIITGSLSAQTMKGNWLLGGNTSFNTYIYAIGHSNAEFIFNLDAGYIILNNLALGAAVNIQNDGHLLYEVGPFTRYYIMNLGKYAKILAQANISRHIHGINATTYGGGIGMAYFINYHLALEGIMGYSIRNFDLDEQNLNTVGVNFGFQVHF